MLIRINSKFRMLNNPHVLVVILYIGLLLVSSLTNVITLLVNSLLLFYFISMNSKKKIVDMNLFLIIFGYGNFVTFQILVTAYAELLPWEELLHFVFYFISCYYYLKFSTNENDTNSTIKRVVHFKLFKKTSIDLNNNEIIKTTFDDDANKNILYIKFLLYLLIGSIYTTQLTFTTLCTPAMIFDWFLIVSDCSLIYSNFYSSVCSACGFFSITISIVVLTQFLKIIKKSILDRKYGNKFQLINLI
ncbi:unnamed protein product [Brachionus calyciflorus]|uniref:Uncharacterized protein n=1 Tax=Brachionus calyciflorus TaxID=104777 RepID=A0A813MEB5_9BILA|nr:unnamed protein product [Brachionus calyciflorus]